ncbi:hypothetical protein EB105725_36_00150 [Shimwellia blattae DSM 4481 = NBRC 105725]|nr:hypothetical protein EB105725_36_00150 [Shimwellia blattae DSM 4481 = NBRC 105725]
MPNRPGTFITNVYVAFRHQGGYDTALPARWGRNTWVCASASNPENGACNTSPMGFTPGVKIRGREFVRLIFTEQRSKQRMEILMGISTYLRWNGGSACGSEATGISSDTSTPAFTSPYYPAYAVCSKDGKQTDGKELNVWFAAQQLPRFTGGIWKARLILNEMQWRPSIQVATFTADITVDVTDKHNGAIYLPAFGRATPLVDLNLRTKPLSTAPGGEVSGGTVIDTCLYDGYNSNSPWLKVTLSDLLTSSGRAADLFSVVKTGAANSQPLNRIDYRVTLNYNGQPVKVENGKEITLTGVNRALIRPVALPGIPHPVICVPAPLTLDVLPFAKASKTAGRYQGTLRVNLSATALAP